MSAKVSDQGASDSGVGSTQSDAGALAALQEESSSLLSDQSSSRNSEKEEEAREEGGISAAFVESLKSADQAIGDTVLGQRDYGFGKNAEMRADQASQTDKLVKDGALPALMLVDSKSDKNQAGEQALSNMEYRIAMGGAESVRQGKTYNPHLTDVEEQKQKIA
jgi:hypothetical protein